VASLFMRTDAPQGSFLNVVVGIDAWFSVVG
jgi:uncharacterized membrane protein YeaQ/YmgE (transglycosylase-associated protein family)